MSTSKYPLHGSCLCGAVRVRLTAAPLLTIACHCRSCQKFSASAYSLTIMFPVEAFSCSGALDQGGLGLEGKNHFFCQSCKNFIYSRLDAAPQRVNLRTSILDEASSFVPFVEVMTDSKMAWATVPAKHSFETVPESADILQAIMNEYQGGAVWSAQ
ncbi:MAG: GFA family protein [Pseudomonadota bacterium]